MLFRSHGLFVATGPSVLRRGRIEAGIADASASLLARMGVLGHVVHSFYISAERT